jgi:hypothetical protein
MSTLRRVGRVVHRPDLDVPIKPPPRPTLGTLLTNFAGAAARWAAHAAKHGLRSTWVTEETFFARLAVCRAGCAHWSEDAALGTGRCLHPACGCTQLKHHLSTERCPLDLWPPMPSEALAKEGAAAPLQAPGNTSSIPPDSPSA